MLTVYARKTREGVEIWRDEQCTKPFAHFIRGLNSATPTRRNKYVWLNCYRWKLQWITP